ncbi:hypothetical protein FFF34_017915 [Inquilinus sp. KBS0705]|nr:hypothetical protein FFF34_017915 [Inquilinus sp. KBS0705]
MLRYLLVIIFIISSTICFAQSSIKGRVFENKTRIALADVLIENLNTKQSLLADKKGMFTIGAKIGDLLVFKNFAYQTDTLVVIDMREKEVFLEPKQNFLNEVTVRTTDADTKGIENYYDPQFHNQPVVYHRNSRTKEYDGGITIRLRYWKKDEKKKARLEKLLKKFDTMDEIASVFVPKNIGSYVPLTGAELDNFISLYTPTPEVYSSKKFNLLDYLNDCYKKYEALPLDKRQLPKLVK